MAQEHVSEAQTIEIDALRQLGDMLKDTKRAEGTKSQIVGGSRGNAVITGSTKTEPPVNNAPTLSDLGINKKTSSLAQKLAKLPEAEVTAIKTSVRTGNSITKAAKDTEKKSKKANQQAENEKLAGKVPDQSERYQLHHANCLEALKLEPASVDWVITDPPYPKEFLQVYDDLGQICAHVLKPEGLAIVMVGQSYLPDILNRLSKHLNYHWTMAYLTPGGQAVQQFQRKVNIFWKPVLLFSKGEYSGQWFGDVCKSDTNDNDKEHHHWGQSESGMYDLMKRFVKPGDCVLDPFLGGGTTAIVALDLACYFTGYDLALSAIQSTKSRLCTLKLE